MKVDFSGSHNFELQKKCEKLFNRQRLGIKPGLNSEAKLLAFMSNPEQSYRVIHIAGTNGKGSTAAIINSILTSAGYRVGLYTSPHLVEFNERFRIGDELVSDDELEKLITLVENASEMVADKIGQQPTFFECSTAIAFEYFKRKKVDIAIIETGMGGRLDSTNVVIPLISVITDISIEHALYLGDTVESVAGEKAGIIKSGRPVVIGNLDINAEKIIQQQALKCDSELVRSVDYAVVECLARDFNGQRVKISISDKIYNDFFFSLMGKYQLSNLATAISVIGKLKKQYKFNISQKAVKDGLSLVRWPGRFQVIKNNPLTILDGAHNPGAAKVLAESLQENADGRDIALVVGMCGDKNPQRFLKYFSGLSSKCWVVPLANKRSMAIDLLKHAAEDVEFEVEVATLKEAICRAQKRAEDCNGIVCITGSLYLVGEVLRELRILG